MRISIVGLPFAGKSSFYEILTSRGMAGSLSGKKGTIATVFVPDPRLDQLTAVYQPKKQVNAALEFLDTPAINLDQQGAGFSGESLSEIKKADALCLVLQDFESAIPHPLGSVDAARDLDTILTEFVFSDLVVLEKVSERLRKVAQAGKKPEDLRQLAAVDKAREALENETPLRDVAFTPQELTALSGYQLLTQKPLLAVLNVGEDDVADLASRIAVGRERFPGLEVTAMCAALELELAGMEEADAAEFMADLGLTQPAFDRILKACFDLLGLQVFYTVGPDECRSWPIPRGSSAYDAAGAIHTDFQKGFIRAVVLPWETFAAAPDVETFKRDSDQRKRDYPMRDGDIVEFRFSVS